MSSILQDLQDSKAAIERQIELAQMRESELTRLRSHVRLYTELAHNMNAMLVELKRQPQVTDSLAELTALAYARIVMSEWSDT